MERLSATIDGDIFDLSLCEDAYGPFRIVQKSVDNKDDICNHSNSKESWTIPERSAGEEDGGRRWEENSYGSNEKVDSCRGVGLRR